MRLSNLSLLVNYGSGELNHYSPVPRKTGPRVQKPLLATRILCLAGIGLVVLTQFFPILYTIDARNIYHRVGFFWLSHAIGIVCVAIDAGMLLAHRQQLSRQERAAFWSYIVLPALAICVQMFVYGLVFLGLADTITMITIFIILQSEQARLIAEQKRLMAEKENQLMQSRVAIMLSQIQPHFPTTRCCHSENCHGKARRRAGHHPVLRIPAGQPGSLQADKPIPSAGAHPYATILAGKAAV